MYSQFRQRHKTSSCPLIYKFYLKAECSYYSRKSDIIVTNDCDDRNRTVTVETLMLKSSDQDQIRTNSMFF